MFIYDLEKYDETNKVRINREHTNLSEYTFYMIYGSQNPAFPNSLTHLSPDGQSRLPWTPFLTSQPAYDGRFRFPPLTPNNEYDDAKLRFC